MSSGRSTIGVLDGAPEMRKALSQLLTCRGFRVEEYGWGADLLEARGSRPLDCLLSHLPMEEVNGSEVLEAFLARQVQVPVIVLTPHDEPGTKERVRGVGAVAYLKKSVDRDAHLFGISAALTHYATTAPLK